MKATIYISLSSKEVEEAPFKVFHEYCNSSDFNTGTQKRKRAEYFTSQELERLPHISRLANRVYNTGSCSIQLTATDYALLDKIGQYLYNNWCIH